MSRIVICSLKQRPLDSFHNEISMSERQPVSWQAGNFLGKYDPDQFCTNRHFQACENERCGSACGKVRN